MQPRVPIAIFMSSFEPGGTEQWAVTAVIAFVAGFSEPFFLKIVQGLSGLDPHAR